MSLVLCPRQPGIQCVVNDKSMLQLLVIIGVKLRKAERNREQAGALRSEIRPGGISTSNYNSERIERRIVQRIALEECIKTAKRPLVRELDTFDIKRDGVLLPGDREHIVRLYKKKFGFRIDEALD